MKNQSADWAKRNSLPTEPTTQGGKMSKLTITEALAEITTIGKRIDKKQEWIGQNLIRQDRLRDPLEKQGGTAAIITQELQAIADLQARLIMLRRAIQQANEATDVTINGVTRTIADWLVWRREIAPQLKGMLSRFASTVQDWRKQAAQKGLSVITTQDVAQSPNDLIINLNERWLAEQIDQHEQVLGALDGQLSLKNATVVIEI
jgi:hypothetical protein